MTTFRFELNRAGIRQILRSKRVQDDLERRARAIATAAGPGHEVDVGVGRNRARASVFTASNAARRAETENRNLSRAIDAGRG